MLDDVVERAVVKTLVRDHAERVWKEKGVLDGRDSCDHPYIDTAKKKRIAFDYHSRLAAVSYPVTMLLAQEKPEEIYEGMSGKKPEDSIHLETRPYGTHLLLSGGDFKAICPASYQEAYGLACSTPYKGVLISRSQPVPLSEDEHIRTVLSTLEQNPVRRSQFQKRFDIPVDEALKRYVQVEDKDLSFRLLPSWKREALRQEHEHVKAFFGPSYKQTKARKSLAVAHHELEHLHSYANGLACPVLSELVSYSVPAELLNPLRFTKENRKSLKKAYEQVMSSELFDQLGDLLSYIQEHKDSLSTGFQRRVLPMTLLELGDIENTSKCLSELFQKIQERGW